MIHLREFVLKHVRICLFSLLATAFIFSGCASKLEQNKSIPTVDTCQEVRGAMDVGSGSTKIKVALVDFCRLKVIKILAEDQVAIAFKENLDEQRNLPSTFLDEASDKIQALANQAARNGIPLEKLAVVATQASREARNISELKASLARKNIYFSTISQEEEAELGHLAAAVVSQLDPRDFTSFDIGGGSFQLVNESGKVRMLGGHLASVSFKNHVLTKVQRRTAAQSPNPIRPKDADKAVQYAKEYVQRLSNAAKGFEIKETVVGIGGVFGNSIRNQLQLGKLDPLRTSYLEKEIPNLIRRTPEELTGPFADTESTNLLLVLGLLKGLEIKEVRVFKANLTDGILLTPRYYRPLEK